LEYNNDVRCEGGKMFGNHKKYRIRDIIIWSTLMISIFSMAQAEVRVMGGYGCKGWIEMVPEKPVLGDNVTITFTITSPYNNTPEFRVEWRYMIGAELTRGNLIQYHRALEKGDTAQFSIDVTIISRRFVVYGVARAHITDRYSGDEWGHTLAAAGVNRIILAEHDTVSYEKFGHDLELWSQIGPEYQYDIQAGVRIKALGMSYSKEAQEIRAQIQLLKKQDPTLTDWDALELMHEAFEEMLWRYGIHDREEAMLILLKARQLMREEGLQKWEAVEQVIEKQQGKNDGLNFFHNGNHQSNVNSFNGERVDITISGAFKYKKHTVNKNTGLNTPTVVMPLRHAKVWVRGYWYESGGSHYYGPDWTDDNGQFSITIQGVNPPGTFIPLVWLRAPSNADRVKLFSHSLTFSFIPACEDSHNWRFRAEDTTVYSNTDYGSIYCGEYAMDGGLWPDNHQPRSGAANIFDHMVAGYEFLVDNNYTTSDTLGGVFTYWQPSDTTHSTVTHPVTGIAPDTIFISGDTLGIISSWTDEWDDWAILHEFGHHVMNRCAVIPYCTTKTHFWDLEYPNDPNLAYSEGWPHFFAAVITDSIYQLDTKKGIGARDDTTYYQNVENPWDYLFVNPPWNDSLTGGPWCEGAIAASLWDAYDSGNNESLYDPHPYTGFPDTALYDSLTVAFDTIWNICDAYDPVSEPLNCHTIFHFRSGWQQFNYGQNGRLDTILLHHRIRDSIPAKPTGLARTRVGDSVDLWWDKNDEADLAGYRVYRRHKPIPGVWGSWCILGENSSPVDTTYLDNTTQMRHAYQYKVTAFDSLGNESIPSDSVTIELRTKPDDPFCFETSLGMRPILTNSMEIELFPSNICKTATVKIYDCCGRLIKREDIIFKNNEAYKIYVKDKQGNQLASGVYFLHCLVDNKSENIEKFVLVK